LKGRPDARGDQ